MSLRVKWPLLGCLTWLISTATLPAQTSKPAKQLPTSAYQLASVKLTGSQRYKPEEISAATGLQIGQEVHEDDFKSAARFLADSGAFNDVSFGFSFSNKGTTVEFQLKDSLDFVPARFENFVWFSDQDLARQLHAQVPLFHGELPVRGEMVNQVSEALQAMLIEAKVEGRPDYVRTGPEGGATEAFDFSVTGPRIAIHEVQFQGVPPNLEPALKAAARKLVGKEYSRSSLQAQADAAFLRVYHQHGYLKAKMGEPEARLLKGEAEETEVDVIFHPDPGPQYKLATITISGNKVVSTADLQKLVTIQVGQPMNAVELEENIAALRHAYGARGYMAAEIKSQEEVDDQAVSVSYSLAITEGNAYTMGELDIHGLDSRTTSEAQTAWTLRTGDTYNSDYPQQFAKQEEERLRDWNVSIHESVNPKDKTVDVTIHFDPRN